MKKLFKPAFIAFAFILLVPDSFSSNRTANLPKSNSVLLSYEWYKDISLFDATGTVLTIADEIERLNYIFSNYTFTSEPAPGLSALEYGYYPSQAVKIIYSNMSW
jgi:hypothetical protein